MTVLAFSTRPTNREPSNREFTLAGNEDVEKELDHFKRKCEEIEHENFVLAERIRDLENER